MGFLILSFFAGVLTVFSPCVFPLLPVILGTSAASKTYAKMITVVVSLVVSIFIFTLLLKASTLLIDIDPDFWKYLSGGILIVLGILTFFPQIWEKFTTKSNLTNKSHSLLNKSSKVKGRVGDILIGASLGPVFSSCSPTYAVIVATVLPVSFAEGLLYLIAYCLGLMLFLFAIGFLGRKLTSKLSWAANPKGAYKFILGSIFIILGVFIILGLDKKFETYLVERGWFDATQIEQQFLD